MCTDNKNQSFWLWPLNSCSKQQIMWRSTRTDLVTSLWKAPSRFWFFRLACETQNERKGGSALQTFINVPSRQCPEEDVRTSWREWPQRLTQGFPRPSALRFAQACPCAAARQSVWTVYYLPLQLAPSACLLATSETPFLALVAQGFLQCHCAISFQTVTARHCEWH